MKKTLTEFKNFIATGNLVDFAIAFVLGIAVKAVIDAFINGIILNMIAAIVGQPNFDAIGFDLGDSRILIGTFLTALVNLLIVGAVLFAVVKAMTKIKKPSVDEMPAPNELGLLTEIRDLLKK
ncbi:MAG: large conductance mechanosensitive channel protein MscL [Acidimicrobiia bacterium]|nr:large conductance mechanosensitive channel protein MscL [Acidimicrobiia bacterium]